jgi:FAD/FMN-containing dehydrogenase
MRLHSHNGVNYERLVSLKNTYDPTNFFALHQQIKPLTNERIEDEQVDT